MVTQKTFSARVFDILKSQGVTQIAVGGVSTAFSVSFGLPRNATFSLSYKAASSGIVELQIQFENSDVLPATELVADANFVVTDEGLDDFLPLADTVLKRQGWPPAASAYGRFKIIGSGANDASTVISKLVLSYILSI